MPVDALEHNYGAVHQHTHREHETRERDQIDGHRRTRALPQQVHEREGADDGNGDRQPDDHGAAYVAQEEIQDDDREQGAHHARIAQIGKPVDDGPGLVEEHPRFQVRELGLRLELVQYGLRALRHVHDVGRGRLVHPHRDRVDPVQALEAVVFRIVELHLRHVAQRQGRARYGQVRHLVGGPVLVHGAYRVLASALGDRAGSHRDIVLHQRLAQVEKVQIVGLQLLVVHVDQQLLLDHAADLHVRHAVDPLDSRLDHLGDDVVELRGIPAPCHAEIVDRRVVRVPSPDAYALQVLGQFSPDLVDAVPDFHGRHVHVRPRLELDADPRVIGVRRGFHVLHVGQRPEGIFQRPGDQAFHFIGRGGRIGGAHVQRREGHLRKEHERKLGIGDHAQGHRADDDHDSRYRSVYGKLGYAHASTTSRDTGRPIVLINSPYTLATADSIVM